MKYLVLLAVVWFSVSVVAGEEKVSKSQTANDAVALGTLATDETPEVTEEAAAAPSQRGVVGQFEIRPSTEVASGSTATENTLGLGYRFNPDLKAEWIQYFGTNVYSTKSEVSGLGFFADEGFLRASFSNVWKSEAQGLSFDVEPRVYLPTFKTERDAGFVTALRGQMKLKKVLSPVVSLSLYDVPILYAYDRDGSVRDGKNTANPVFGNRVYFIADVTLGKGFAFSLPFLLYMTRNRTFSVPDAANSNTWTFVLYSWPELTYSVNDNLTLGVAYRTASFADNNLRDWNLGKSLDDGTFQFILSATL